MIDVPRDVWMHILSFAAADDDAYVGCRDCCMGGGDERWLASARSTAMTSRALRRAIDGARLRLEWRLARQTTGAIERVRAMQLVERACHLSSKHCDGVIVPRDPLRGATVWSYATNGWDFCQVWLSIQWRKQQRSNLGGAHIHAMTMHSLCAVVRRVFGLHDDGTPAFDTVSYPMPPTLLSQPTRSAVDIEMSIHNPLDVIVVQWRGVEPESEKGMQLRALAYRCAVEWSAEMHAIHIRRGQHYECRYTHALRDMATALLEKLND